MSWCADRNNAQTPRHMPFHTNVIPPNCHCDNFSNSDIGKFSICICIVIDDRLMRVLNYTDARWSTYGTSGRLMRVSNNTDAGRSIHNTPSLLYDNGMNILLVLMRGQKCSDAKIVVQFGNCASLQFPQDAWYATFCIFSFDLGFQMRRCRM